MSPSGHFAVGFVAKRFVPKINVLVLLAAAYTLDLLYFIFMALGLDSAASSPWSHSLVMAIAWSSLLGIVGFAVAKSPKAGIALAIMCFSHWILDFISWNNLPLFFNNPVRLGFGLYNAIGFDPANLKFSGLAWIATALETTMLLVGLAMYLFWRKGAKPK